ncbi:hypothetical protein BSKO_04511 [Bryopsis sp. KO-2023]|nr:hypothetical protein BSKO_04511 [Bryopsis sp. KO-2023]
MMRGGVVYYSAPGAAKTLPRSLPQGLPIRCVGTQRPLPGSRNRRPTSLRVMCGEKKDEAKRELRKSLQKTHKSLKKSLASIEKELGKDVGGDANLVDSEASWSELYEEQKVLFDREIARWNEERKMWDKREEILLAELRRLQNLVVDISAGYMPDDARPEGYMGEGEDSMVENRNGSVPLQAEIAPEATTETQEEVEFFGAKQGESSPSPELSSLAASMTAAFAAVDQGDVLSDDFFQEHMKESVTKEPPVESTDDGKSTEEADTESGPVETVKSLPTGPPPVLMQGDDDIFWMNQLQRGLEAKGFCCGDDEVDDYYFAEGTANALLSFQACNSLAETGVADEETWKALLGQEMKPVMLEGESLPELDSDAVTSSQTAADSQETPNTEAGVSSQTPVASKEAPTPPVVTHDGELLYEFDKSNGAEKNGEEKAEEKPQSQGGGATDSGKHVSVDPKVPRTKNGWPALAELDGGKEVHHLQALLAKNGFHCGEDDMNWWYFGSDTVAALKTFQACSDLPESGVCDEKTWLALCGPDAKPSDLIGVEGSHEEDRANVEEGSRGVWLLGEQRWEMK